MARRARPRSRRQAKGRVAGAARLWPRRGAGAGADALTSAPLSEAAPAKLNLALHLRRRRADGYHDLETLFAFTDFGDTLTVAAGDGLSLAVTGPFAAATGDDNLVLRAARALAAAAGRPAAAALHLEKRIPVAAGLGGGSADAAATLRLLNRFWRLDWPIARLLPLAAALGADVPACLAGTPCLGVGRGDELRPWDAGRRLAGTPALLVNPGVAVPTGPVFAGWDGHDRGVLDPAAPLAMLRNDLTPPAIALAPVIADMLAALAVTGPTLSRMSGSGATCFALYGHAAGRDSAAELLAMRGWWTASTVLSGAPQPG